MENMIRTLAEADKKTPVKLYIREKAPVDYGSARVFGAGDKIVFGDWRELQPILEQNRESIADIVIESTCRNSAAPLLDTKDLPARIEPGALIREGVIIEERAVIMMGAVVNIGARIGSGSMIDMGAVIGSRCEVGKDCHIGAGAVLAGVLEPPSAVPVVIEDHVLVGANAVILEGVHVEKNAVIAAGAVVTENVPAGVVVGGCPARILKKKDAATSAKAAISEALRTL